MNRNYDPKPQFFNLGFEPQIGQNCSLVDCLFDCAAPIFIHDNVAFGHGCKLLTAKHDITKFREQRMLASIYESITVQSGVWVASGVTICGGVTIGADSVVGANSLVLKDIPPRQFWAGTPAKFIKNL